MKKLTFLMAAHNEEEYIGKALDRLAIVKKDYPKTEVLIGLDACTDNTKKIVQKYKFVKYFELNKRNKQGVLDELEKHITGDIVIIHDADWVFAYNNKKELLRLIKLFDDPTIGGVTNIFSTLFEHDKITKVKSFGFLGVAWVSYYIGSFQKKYMTKKRNGLLYIDKTKMMFPFYLDYYKKSALDETKRDMRLTAGDHIERTLRLLNQGYEIIVVDDEKLPRFLSLYQEQSLRSVYTQRLRGAIAKKKISNAYKYKVSPAFYPLFLWHILTNLYRMKRLKDFIGLLLFTLIGVITLIASWFYRTNNVKKVWGMRIR